MLALAISRIGEFRSVRTSKHKVHLPQNPVIWTIHWIKQVDATEPALLENRTDLVEAGDPTAKIEVINFNYQRIRLFERLLRAIQNFELESMRVQFDQIGSGQRTFGNLMVNGRHRDLSHFSLRRVFRRAAAKQGGVIKRNFSDSRACSRKHIPRP